MANITDYNAIFESKNKIDAMFNEMTEGLKESQSIVEEMSSGSWSGESYEKFESDFQDILGNITHVKENFSAEIDMKLKEWYEQFNEAEQKTIQEAGKLV
jgi:uncharacterized protein YukE